VAPELEKRREYDAGFLDPLYFYPRFFGPTFLQPLDSLAPRFLQRLPFSSACQQLLLARRAPQGRARVLEEEMVVRKGGEARF
jgi:hypothetical protein